MPSPAHDVLVQALHDDVALLPAILSRLRGVELPPLVGPMDSVVRLARPVEVRPDVVHRTDRGWVVCEVQHAIDRKKGRRWLVASSVLFDETQQMGDVVVLTPSAAVARWARRAGHVRGPAGTRLQITPVVVYLSPSAARALLDPEAPHLALCAAWAMQRRHGKVAAEVADDAIRVTERLPQPLQDAQARAIFDILHRQLYARLLREAHMHPNQTPERPSVRKLRELLEEQGMAKGMAKGEASGMAKGEAKGRAAGFAEAKQADLLLIFSERGLPVTAEERARIAACTDVEQLSDWLRRAITTGSAAEALAPGATPLQPAARPQRAPAKPRRRASR